MKTFRVRVERTETYSDYIEVEAESAEEAMKEIQDDLDNEGWDAVFDDDGDYEECVSDAVSAEEVEDE